MKRKCSQHRPVFLSSLGRQFYWYVSGSSTHFFLLFFSKSNSIIFNTLYRIGFYALLLCCCCYRLNDLTTNYTFFSSIWKKESRSKCVFFCSFFFVHFQSYTMYSLLPLFELLSLYTIMPLAVEANSI